MIGKWINGTLVTPSTNERQKIIVANPSESVLKFVMGYKDIIEAEKPEYDENAQYLQIIKTDETDDAIYVSWEVKNIELTEEMTDDE